MTYERVPDLSATGQLRRVITIDGPAAAGKSTVARLLARRLGFVLLDSGALYRGLALHLLRRNLSPDDPDIPQEALSSLDLHIEPDVALMKVFLGAEDVTGLIRDERTGVAASRFSVRPEVRRVLLTLQRSAGLRWDLVAEGRDMGTVVFPDAPVKFFLSADLGERSRRRFEELLGRGEHADQVRVLSEMRQRDRRDESRQIAPLVRAEDSTAVDATNLSPDEVVDLMMAVAVRTLGLSAEPA